MNKTKVDNGESCSRIDTDNFEDAVVFLFLASDWDVKIKVII